MTLVYDSCIEKEIALVLTGTNWEHRSLHPANKQLTSFGVFATREEW